MLNVLSDLPVGVIGFETEGKLNAEDYRDVLLPALNEAARSGDVRFVIVIREWQGMSAGAV